MLDAQTQTPTFDILATGNELLSGDILDTNSKWLCQQFASAGLAPGRVVWVGDQFEPLCLALREALDRSDVVIVTGGLGPTTDDLTRAVAAEVWGVPLRRDARALEQIAAQYAAFGRGMTEGCYQQADLPEGAELLENRWGTAPCFALERERPSGARSLAVFLPGVPKEMERVFEAYIAPRLGARFGLPPRRRHVLRCIGLPESVANERMRGFSWPGITVGYRAASPEVHVKLEVEGAAGEESLARGALADAEARMGRERFGTDCGPLEEVVARLLGDRGETVAVAESCTAGRLAAALTGLPGSSAWFIGGALVYSNAEKIRQCGIEEETLARVGAVSEEVARGLAEGIRARTGATWGIGVTGIAGPGGGTAEKPVGTVHIAVAGPDRCRHRALLLPGDRERIMRFSVGAALELLRRSTLGV